MIWIQNGILEFKKPLFLAPKTEKKKKRDGSKQKRVIRVSRAVPSSSSAACPSPPSTRQPRQQKFSP